MQKLKSILKGILFSIILYFVISFFGILFNPNLKQNLGYSSYRFEKEEANSIDVLLLGSSFMYCSYSPMEAYEQGGIKSYVVAGPEQSMITSYHNFKKTLETQIPKLVVIEVKGLSFDSSEKYQGNSIVNVFGKDVDLDEVPLINQVNKLSQALEGKMVIGWPENFYNFFTYHDRWNVIEEEDYLTAGKYFADSFAKDYYKGFVKLYGVGNNINPIHGDLQELSESYDLNISYLDKIVKLCNENNIEVAYISTPNVSLDHYNNYIDEVRKNYANNDLIVVNDILDEINFDMYQDMFDWGHTNHAGASKITTYMVEYFRTKGLLTNKLFYDNDWNENLKEYKNEEY